MSEVFTLNIRAWQLRTYTITGEPSNAGTSNTSTLCDTESYIPRTSIQPTTVSMYIRLCIAKTDGCQQMISKILRTNTILYSCSLSSIPRCDRQCHPSDKRHQRTLSLSLSCPVASPDLTEFACSKSAWFFCFGVVDTEFDSQVSSEPLNHKSARGPPFIALDNRCLKVALL